MCKGPNSRELDVTRLEFCETVVGGRKSELARNVELLGSLRLMRSFIKNNSAAVTCWVNFSSCRDIWLFI